MQPPLSAQYLCPSYTKLLSLHQLANFDALWNYQGDWFEKPNRARGGWSGVNYIALADEQGKLHGFFLKRQEGHQRKTWRHPFIGEPTFVREYQILQFLNQHNEQQPKRPVMTPQLVFFAQKNKQCILMTKALTGFVSADSWLKNHVDAPAQQQHALLKAMAHAVKNLHLAGVQHRALYLKHLFVKAITVEQQETFEVALIDFEKARLTQWINFFRWMDLIKLHQRSPKLSEENKIFFLKSYLNINQLTWMKQQLWRCFYRKK